MAQKGFGQVSRNSRIRFSERCIFMGRSIPKTKGSARQLKKVIGYDALGIEFLQSSTKRCFIRTISTGE